MSSAAEQLAANFNFKAFAKAADLKKRLWFTLGALIVYRLGTYIPLPGINTEIMREIATQSSGGILSIIDTFSGGALSRMTIFALNIMPYISASIIVQLMTAVSPQLEALKKEGESGRKKINQYTRYLTVILAIVQAYGISAGLEVMRGVAGSAVIDPGFAFRFSTVVTLTGGTLFLMWLGEQITSRGIGNGASLLIFTGIVANLPHAVVATLELGRTGALSSLAILLIMVMVVAVIAFIVFMERAQRRVYIQYPKQRTMGGMPAREGTHLPMKINSSGVIPPIFAGSLLGIPATAISFSANNGPEWLTTLSSYITRGHPVYIAVYVSLIVFFAFFYTAIVFNPNETADNLKKAGGFIAGYRPGQATANYLDFILTRLTVLGAAYLAVICILPELLISKISVPFYFGGTSLLIVVSVTMDTVTQIHSHMLSHQYEGLLKKSRLRAPSNRNG